MPLLALPRDLGGLPKLVGAQLKAGFERDLVIRCIGGNLVASQAMVAPLSPMLYSLMQGQACCGCGGRKCSKREVITLQVELSKEVMIQVLWLCHTGEVTLSKTEEADAVKEAIHMLGININIDLAKTVAPTKAASMESYFCDRSAKRRSNETDSSCTKRLKRDMPDKGDDPVKMQSEMAKELSNISLDCVMSGCNDQVSLATMTKHFSEHVALDEASAKLKDQKNKTTSTMFKCSQCNRYFKLRKARDHHEKSVHNGGSKHETNNAQDSASVDQSEIYKEPKTEPIMPSNIIPLMGIEFEKASLEGASKSNGKDENSTSDGEKNTARQHVLDNSAFFKERPIEVHIYQGQRIHEQADGLPSGWGVNVKTKEGRKTYLYISPERTLTFRSRSCVIEYLKFLGSMSDEELEACRKSRDKSATPTKESVAGLSTLSDTATTTKKKIDLVKPAKGAPLQGKSPAKEICPQCGRTFAMKSNASKYNFDKHVSLCSERGGLKDTNTKDSDPDKQEVATTGFPPNATEEKDSKIEEAENMTEKKFDSEKEKPRTSQGTSSSPHPQYAPIIGLSKCQLCDKEFKKFCELRNHYTTFHYWSQLEAQYSGWGKTCFFCFLEFSTNDLLLTHMGNFHCAKSIDLYLLHDGCRVTTIEWTSKLLNSTCGKCGKGGMTSSSLKIHMSTAHFAKQINREFPFTSRHQLKCYKCKLIFPNITKRTGHIGSVHDEVLKYAKEIISVCEADENIIPTNMFEEKGISLPLLDSDPNVQAMLNAKFTPTSFSCRKCTDTFETRELLKNHIAMKHYFDKLSKAYAGTVCSISPCGLEAHKATSNEELIKHIAEKHEKVLTFLLQKDRISLPPNQDKKKEPLTPPPNSLKIQEPPLKRPNVKIETGGVDLMSLKSEYMDESNSSHETERKSFSSESEGENKRMEQSFSKREASAMDEDKVASASSREDQQNQEEKGINITDDKKAEDNNNPNEGSKEKNKSERKEISMQKPFRFSSCEVEKEEVKEEDYDKNESDSHLKAKDEENGTSSGIGIRALFDSDSD